MVGRILSDLAVSFALENIQTKDYEQSYDIILGQTVL